MSDCGKIHPGQDYLTQGGENGQDWFEQWMILTNFKLIDFISLTMRHPAREIPTGICQKNTTMKQIAKGQ